MITTGAKKVWIKCWVVMFTLKLHTWRLCSYFIIVLHKSSKKNNSHNLMKYWQTTLITYNCISLSTSSQASKLRQSVTTTLSLTGAKCRATSVAKNYLISPCMSWTSRFVQLPVPAETHVECSGSRTRTLPRISFMNVWWMLFVLRWNNVFNWY